jgi:hypothetical protein
MTSAVNAPTEFHARGWILWLTWIYLVLFGIGTLFGVAALILGGKLFGLEMSGPDQVTVFWVLLQVPYIAFAVGCVGVLLRDRDFGWVTVIAAWVITIVQGVQTVLQLAHLRLSIPLSAFLFAAYAIGMTRLLRPVPARDARIGQGMI